MAVHLTVNKRQQSGVAQSAVQETVNFKVIGSSPIPRAKSSDAKC